VPNEILGKYGTVQTVSDAVEGLASDTNLLAGWQSAVLDFTTTRPRDVIINIKRTTAASGTITANTRIEVWAIAWDGSGWPDTFTATAGGKTLTSANVKAPICCNVVAFFVDATNARTYTKNGISLVQVFGGCLPSRCAIFTVQNTGQALHATAGNHSTTYQTFVDEIQ
jgi:hypothetical protein